MDLMSWESIQMGICQSQIAIEALETNLDIDKEMEMERRKLVNTIRLFLLGPAESGKTTVRKQLRILHDNGFSEEEITQQKAVIYSNTLTGMFSMLEAMQTLDITFQNPNRKKDAEMVFEVVNLGEESEPIGPELAAALKRLWADGGVGEVYRRRNEYQLDDSTKYFLDALDRITEDYFRPTQNDVLRTRVKTTGIVEIKLKIKNIGFRVIDVGGQRSERRKWIHFFENVQAVIFVIAISEFDQVLQEDETTNRMGESLQLFDEICNSKWFDKSSMILFLNKIDLFQEKLQRTSIKFFFQDYDGPQDLEPSAAFVEQKFKELNRNAKRSIYAHRTCATDTGQVQFVLDSSIDVILQNYLDTCGLH